MHRRKPIKFLSIRWYKLIISALTIDNQSRYSANGRFVNRTSYERLCSSFQH